MDFASSLYESLRAHAFDNIDGWHDDMLLPQRLQKRVCQDNAALRLASQVRKMLDEVTEV